MEPLTPIHTAELFPGLHAELIALPRGLDDAGWSAPTVAGGWRVRDVAAHLLDGDLRKLSICRDGHTLAPDGPVSSFDDIVGLINRANASGVVYARRLSPRVITDLLEVTGRWVSDHVAGLPPHGEAVFSVAWAGEERSENWMDTGREYTERWHHQMQIRDAVGAPGLLGRRWLHPLLELSVRALPRAYEGTDAAARWPSKETPRWRSPCCGRARWWPDPESGKAIASRRDAEARRRGEKTDEIHARSFLLRVSAPLRDTNF